LLIVGACQDWMALMSTSLATFTVTVLLWAAHVHVGRVASFAALLKIGMCAATELGLVLLLLVPVGLALPSYNCYTDRAKASEVLLGLATAKQAITQKALAASTVRGSGEGVAVAIAGRLSAGVVTSDGIIIGAGEDPAVVFILTPTLDQARVTWRCVGYPVKSVPMSCRPK
jgi:hypothetical protein